LWHKIFGGVEKVVEYRGEAVLLDVGSLVGE